MLRHQLRVAPPQPDLMALQPEIAGGGERAIAPAQDCDLQVASP
jgi:hypothetical protein